MHKKIKNANAKSQRKANINQQQTMYTVCSKTQMPKMLLVTSAWFAFREHAGCAVSVAWLSCILVLEFASRQYMQECFSVRFGFIATLFFLSKGWQSQTLLFRKGLPFPGDDPAESLFVLLFFLQYLSFQFFAISSKRFWRSPIWIGTFLLGWPLFHGVSLNIGHFSSASWVQWVPSMCSPFVKCAPLQAEFASSIFPPFAMFASFQIALSFSIFSATVMCASFRFAFFHSMFSLFLHFSRCKHPGTSAVRQHK